MQHDITRISLSLILASLIRNACHFLWHSSFLAFPLCLYSSQFAGEGPIPFLVKARDLMPEVTQDVAWQQIVAVFNDFMLVQLQQPGAGGVIATMVGATAKFVAPIIAAYEMEGSRHFNAPAQIGGPGASQCVQGGCVIFRSLRVHTTFRNRVPGGV